MRTLKRYKNVDERNNLKKGKERSVILSSNHNAKRREKRERERKQEQGK
jgi:hypothetical protein